MTAPSRLNRRCVAVRVHDDVHARIAAIAEHEQISVTAAATRLVEYALDRLGARVGFTPCSLPAKATDRDLNAAGG